MDIANQTLESKTILLAQYDFPTHFAAADAVGATNTTWIEQQWETARIRQKTSGAPEYLLVIDEIRKQTTGARWLKSSGMP